MKKEKEPKEKKPKRPKGIRPSAGFGWVPDCGHRERPEHLWRRLMDKGY